MSSAEPVRIIHPTDFSAEAEAAEEEAARLARAFAGELVLVHVATESPLYGETTFGMNELKKIFQEQARWAESRLGERARYLASHGATTGWRRRVGVPHEEILLAAAEEHAAYIVMGTHGRGGVGRFMLGSVVDRVVRAAACPVVIVPPRGSSAHGSARDTRRAARRANLRRGEDDISRKVRT
jgi:nucleotide-binding universal stress UspA family protein